MNQDGAVRLTHQTYSVSATAARIGVAPATLRTWARRHGIGPSEHASGTHRRYTETDLAKLMYMRAMMLRGSSASEAAKYALALSGHALVVSEAENVLHAEEQKRENSEAVQGVSQFGNAPTHGFGAMPSLRIKGAGLSLAPSIASSIEATDYKGRCTELVAAALRGDQQGCAQLVEVRDGEDLIDWWKLLVRPALDRISSQTMLAKPGCPPKLLIGYAAQNALAELTCNMSLGTSSGASTKHSRKKTTLVFSPEQDDLSLSAHVLVAALLAQGADAHVILGPGNSQRAAELIRMVKPTVVVFASDQVDPDLSVLNDLSEGLQGVPVYVGVREAVGIERYSSLSEIRVFSSIRALFHEVYGIVRSTAPDAQYWEDEDAVVTLRSI